MCGIAMLFKTGDSVSDDELNRMIAALKHRGPDGSGVHVENNFGIVHTRLSIVDVAGGKQPLYSHDGRYVISFNGEIYNYAPLKKELTRDGARFQTQSDTEVIVELYRRYGTACLSKLRGMFSFVIYDKNDSTFFIARDRLGIKPLFYFSSNNYFILASEMKAIFASGLVEPVFNWQSIRNFFYYQFNISPHTLFEDVVELPPGHYILTKNFKVIEPVQYWDLIFPQMDGRSNFTDQQWIEQFDHTLHDSAAQHTIGEVPIGAYLSGGIDSSATTYYLQQHYAKTPNTFSIHFKNPALDESAAYRAVSNKFNLPNYALAFDDDKQDGYVSELERCLYHLEQPQRMAVDIPHLELSKFVRSRQTKVVYTGDGADEILAGYDCFRQDMMRVWGNDKKSYGEKKKWYLKEYTPYFAEDYVRLLLKLHAPSRQKRIEKKFGTYPAWFDFWQIMSDDVKNVFRGDILKATDIDSQMSKLLRKLKPSLNNIHPLNQSLYLETKMRLPGWILWKSDRLSMANGVEARVPFLDHHVVELAAKLPPHLKLNGMDEKYVLKKIMQDKLPEVEGNYKKRGFYTPITEWFFTKDKEKFLGDYFDETQLTKTGFFQPQAIDLLLRTARNLKDINTLNDYYRKNKVEWLLMLALSIQILHRQFIAKDAACFKR